jgi:hypothetical protein
VSKPEVSIEQDGRGLQWFKSSYSGTSGGECVEVAKTPTTTHVRDSKTPARPALAVPADAWLAFLDLATTIPA